MRVPQCGRVTPAGAEHSHPRSGGEGALWGVMHPKPEKQAQHEHDLWKKDELVNEQSLKNGLSI